MWIETWGRGIRTPTPACLLLVSLMWTEVTVTSQHQRSVGPSMAFSPFQSNSIMEENDVRFQPSHKSEMEEEVIGVSGELAQLPCHTSPPQHHHQDQVKLVLWFRGQSARPIYTYDTRGKGDKEAIHWSNTSVLTGRALFKATSNPGMLVLDRLAPADEGDYRCRVDFYRAPTRTTKIKLEVIVPPENPKIFDDRENEVRSTLGPYRIGERVVVRCESWGGSPPPKLIWWRDHAMLDDSYETLGFQKVINNLVLGPLSRSDLMSALTCQASNNNMSAPSTTMVKIDMHFGPLSVHLVKTEGEVAAGKSFEAKCEVVGARPVPRIRWWKGADEITESIITHVSPDKNVTLSIVTFVPTIEDSGKLLSCRASDPRTGEGSLEDGIKLNISYVPLVSLSLGPRLNASDIREDEDVYLECAVRANPSPYKISWRRNDTPLVQNMANGIFVSNQTLVIQKISKEMSGIYTCFAHNTQGDGVSNPVTLNVRYAPYCKPDQVLVYGVARYEKVRISCEVVSNPAADLSYHWVFNTSANSVNIDQSVVRVDGTRSVVEYVPRTELDYGTFQCWARNSIGAQKVECSYHLIPAGKPDPVHNCTIVGQTYTSLSVECGAGFNGGQEQTFHLLVQTADTRAVVANLTTNPALPANGLTDSHHAIYRHYHSRSSPPGPRFDVGKLSPGEGYILTLYASNAKGASEPMSLHAFTLRETQPKHVLMVEAESSRANGNANGVGVVGGGNNGTGVSPQPVLVVLVGVGCGLALMAVLIIIIMRINQQRQRQTAVHHHRRHLHHHGLHSATATATSLGDSDGDINDDDGDDGGSLGGLGKRFRRARGKRVASKADSHDEDEFDGEDIDTEDDLSHRGMLKRGVVTYHNADTELLGEMQPATPLAGSSQRWSGKQNNPDVVPIPITNAEYLDQEGGFYAGYPDKRYATLGRNRMEKESDKSLTFRQNLSRLSREVTYAEFTLPRGKGYTPMQRLQSPQPSGSGGQSSSSSLLLGGYNRCAPSGLVGGGGEVNAAQCRVNRRPVGPMGQQPAAGEDSPHHDPRTPLEEPNGGSAQVITPNHPISASIQPDSSHLPPAHPVVVSSQAEATLVTTSYPPAASAQPKKGLWLGGSVCPESTV